MRWILIILLFVAIGLITYGFIINSSAVRSGEFYIGIGTVLLFFIIIPLFLYSRRNKMNADKYILTKENLKKMREKEGKTS